MEHKKEELHQNNIRVQKNTEYKKEHMSECKFIHRNLDEDIVL